MPTSWYKGNLHMHSLWSDGDDFPELIAARFKAAGYHFIAFTEHDRFQDGEPPADRGLKSLSEYRGAVEERGRFLILNGEEVTVHCGARSHWINVINAPRSMGPIHADGNTADAVQRLIREVEHFDRPCLVSFNHPNYVWNATAEDLAEAEPLRFFEIHTALNSTHSYGDEDHAGVERQWDVALALRLARESKAPLFGIATDDSHAYDTAEAGPFRAWVMVRASELTPEALVRSMDQGDFYASTGVTLASLESDASGIKLAIEPAPGVNYTTSFIGMRRGGEKEPGTIRGEVDGPEATYDAAGDEAYVRALITSDCPHPCPSIPGDVMKAWTQPVYPSWN